MYVTRFDGSGVFVNTGNANYVARPWSNGRGNEMLSPSGIGHTTQSNDLGVIEHNGNLYMVGAIHNKEGASTNDWTEAGWTYQNESLNSISRGARSYCSLVITSDGRKIFPLVTQFTPGANAEHTHTTDALSFGDDLYFCNSVDVGKIQGGSGTLSLIHTDLTAPSPKALALFPTLGYSNGIPQGEPKVMFQDGSGVVYRETTSGCEEMVRLGSLASSTRNTDGYTPRINTGDLEPARSVPLVNFSNELHSFIPTATSGYQHFTCNGDPSGTSNWTNRTGNLPEAIIKYDSSMYYYRDDFRNRLYVCNVTMGEVGVIGHAGIQRAAGGVYIHELDAERNWREVYRGVPGQTPRGLLPLQITGPFVNIPSGMNPEVFKCNDYAIMDYTLHDLENRAVDITVEYSIDNGLSWNPATRFRDYTTGLPLGSGVENLSTNLEGIPYEFYWHYINDIGFNVQEDSILRITPKLRTLQ